MKKIFTLFAILMMAMTAWADETYLVSTPEDFRTHVKANHNIVLTADIDLSQLKSDKSDVLFDNEFTGTIDGMYVQTPGDTIISQLKNSKVIFFEKMNGAAIKNVVISDCYFDGWDSGSGQIACEASNSHFTNVVMLQCSAVGDRNAYDCDKMGGMVGIAKDCNFYNVKILDSSLRTDGQEAGLIVGEASGCSFDNCMTNLSSNIWANGNSYLGVDGNAYVGGLCGYATNTKFTQCINLALVGTEDDRAGGILGYGEKATMTDCMNYGIVCNNNLQGHLTMAKRILTISTWSYVGYNAAFFIVGASIKNALLAGEGTLTALNVLNTMAVVQLTVIPVVIIAAWATYAIIDANYEPDEMGGIAGCLKNNSSVHRCSNYGPIDCYDAYCGGIVGYADGSHIEECLNQSFVCAQEQAGGIVGYAKSCYVRYNLNMGIVRTDIIDYNGMIVGVDEKDNTTSDNYFLDNAVYDSDEGHAVIQEQLASGEVTLALNHAIGSNTFRQNLGKSIYPTLDPTAPVVTAFTPDFDLWQKVKDSGEFLTAITNLSAKIELTADIDLSGTALFSLFTEEHPFCGEIKGNGYSLMNLSYEVAENRYDDDKEVNAAYFAFAKNAKFDNLVIRNFRITQKDEKLGDHPVEAFLVANSTNCTYTNIQIKESTIYVNKDRDALRYVGGIVAKSNGDTFTGCSLDGYCALQAHVGASTDNAYLGGIAGKATGSTFTQCYSSAVLWSDDNYDGGIVGWAENCTIDRCLNTGLITAQEYVGGIAGYGKNTVVTHCVNTGAIADDDNKREDYRSGIVGYLEGGNASVSYCINYGSVNYSTESTCSPINNKREKGATYGDGNYFYCQFNGKHTDNIGEETYNNMKSGEYALNMTDGEGNHWLYQSIDNDIDFPTNMPVPITAAGKVYSNNNCYWKQLYSNIYHTQGSHLPILNDYGICTLCGNKYPGHIKDEIHISNAEGMLELAHNVNSGVNLSGRTIYLDNDIDMNDYDYVAIGKDADRPFRGTFDAQGHHIKNLRAYSTQRTLGLFGCVSDTTVIKNLTIDSSCRFIGTGYGAAGIVGCMARKSDDLSYPISLTLDCCGNEADVSGETNAAGLIGGVYNTDTHGNATVIITNCYNTGNISGSGVGGCESAALIAYGNSNTTVKNCYNTGTITGCWNGLSMVRCKNGSTVTVENIYNLEGVATENSAYGDHVINTKQVYFGELCNKLNAGNSSTVWSQNLGTDTHPVFGSAGLKYTRTLANEWGTLVLPFSVNSSSDVQYYSILYFGSDELCVKAVDRVEPNTPCLFKSAAGIHTLALEDTDYSSVAPDSYSPVTKFEVSNGTYGSLIGAYASDSISVDDLDYNWYINGDKFWRSTDKFALPAFRCYLRARQWATQRRAISIMIESTDISETDVEGRKDGKYLENGKVVIIHNGKKYNMAGQLFIK